MLNLLFISYFILLGEGLSIERSSFDGNNSGQLRLARADFPPFDSYLDNNDDYNVFPELPMERYEPGKQYPIPPIEEGIPIRVLYHVAPQEQIEFRPPFDTPSLPGNYMNELQQPFIGGNGDTRLIRGNSRKSFASDEGTEVDLELPNESGRPVVSYFLPNIQEPNVQEKRSEQEAQADSNRNLGRSEQEIIYELEIKRERENERAEEASEKLENARKQENSSELENKSELA